MGNSNRIGTGLLIFCGLLYSACGKLDPEGFIHSSYPVNERVKQSLELNSTIKSREVIVAGNEYSLLVAGDSHVGGTKNLFKFLSAANTPGISGMVMVGDLTTGHAEDYDSFKRALDFNNSGPAFMIPGNHDLFFEGWKSFFYYFGSSVYSFRVITPDTSDLYICLDSGSGTHGWRQIEWLENLLAGERGKNRYCIIFTHVNFFREHRTTSTNPLVDELRTILGLCYNYSVNMVITGHDHRRSADKLGGTTFVTLDALEDGFSDASYLRLNIREAGPEYIFEDI